MISPLFLLEMIFVCMYILIIPTFPRLIATGYVDKQNTNEFCAQIKLQIKKSVAMRRINCRDDADHRPPYQMCHISAAYGIWRHQHTQTLAHSMPYAMVNCHAHQQIACKTFTLNFDKEQLMMIKKERGYALRVNYSRMRVWCLLLLPPLPLAPLHLSFYWPVFV